MKMNKVVSGILLYGFIGLGAVISLFPFYWLAVMATNSSAAFMRFPPVMVFGGQFMTNMTNLLNSIQFGRAMFNTFVVPGILLFCKVSMSRKEIFICTVSGDHDDTAPAQPDPTADHHEQAGLALHL